MTERVLPELPYEAWEATKNTLHLYAQIVGKIKLATAAPRNHWWSVPLYVDVRGLTTGRMTRDGTSFDLTFDLHEHRRRHDLDVDIREQPFGIAITTPFPADSEHASYDRDYVERFWRVLEWT